MDLSLENSTEPVYNETFVLTCTATITPPKKARCIFQETQIEWVGPDGNVPKSSSGIIVGDQVVIQKKATRTLTFSSLNYGHEGEYTCRTKCVKSTPQSFTIKIIGKNNNRFLYTSSTKIILLLHVGFHYNMHLLFLC